MLLLAAQSQIGIQTAAVGVGQHGIHRIGIFIKGIHLRTQSLPVDGNGSHKPILGEAVVAVIAVVIGGLQ